MFNTRMFAFAAAFAGALVTASLGTSASAQEISDSHLAAARQAVGAMRATEEFNDVLASAALNLRGELIQRNPDLEAEIAQIINETAISLAARRADLEREAALAYARVFNEAELGEISAFYRSETGQKLINDSQIVAREIFQAAEIWQRGLVRDLTQQVADKLSARFEDATLPEGAATEGTQQ